MYATPSDRKGDLMKVQTTETESIDKQEGTERKQQQLKTKAA